MFDAGRLREPRGFESAAAEVVVEPASLDEIGELVRKCERDRICVAPIGACRTLRCLRSAPVSAGVSLIQMAGVIAHEPDDMTVVVGAGATLAALEAVLARHGQHLPVDPPFPDQTTVGAMLGAAHSGLTRLSAGTVRDFLIGVQFVGHGGKAVRGGGRVVKNVAGYDLMKVMIGSFGTLGIITEATFKLRPLPELYAIAIGYHCAPAEAFETGFRLHDALALLHLELLSPGIRTPLTREGQYLLAAGVGGNRKDADYQLEEIRRLQPGTLILEGADARRFYRVLRDAELPQAPLRMQIAALPRQLPSCLDRPGLQFRAHAAAGVAQLALDDAETAAGIRRAAADARGHARVLSLQPALRGLIPIFDQPPSGALKLMRRLKAAFDPAGIFNPGCFVGGI